MFWQTVFAFLILFRHVTRPVFLVGYLSMEYARHKQDLSEVLPTGLAMFATGYLWVLLPVWLLRGGIQVHCHRCHWSLPVGWYQGVLPCPNCDGPFDARTGDRLAGVSPESRREVPHTSAEGGP